MAKGRPADPTRARRGTGNRPKPNEAKVTDIIVPPHDPFPVPAHLDDEGKEMFLRVVNELSARGLREADLAAVEMLVTAYQRHQEARRWIDKQGILVRGQRGAMVNPLLKIEKDSAATYLRLADAFGLTLASRLRLGLMQLAGESMLSALNADLDGRR